MKKILIITSFLLLMSCGIKSPYEISSTGDMTYTVNEFKEVDVLKRLPVGAIITGELGNNWWRGSFEHREIIIQMVRSYGYLNAEIVFTGKVTK